MSKYVETKTIAVQDVMSKIDDKCLKKPIFQRPKKWKLETNDTVASIQAYITFLEHTKNGVNVISCYTHDGILWYNIDGNNRLNATSYYMKSPFKVFPKRLEPLVQVLCDYSDVVKIFEDISYNGFMSIRRFATFIGEKTEHEFHYMKVNEIDNIIEKIQVGMMVGEGNNKKQFDVAVTIDFKLFVNYSSDEVKQIFLDTNRYTSHMTPNEIQAAYLSNLQVEIENDRDIKNQVIEYFKQISINEALECYIPTPDTPLNLYTAIVGIRNVCSTYCSIIEKFGQDTIKKRNEDVFFKLFKQYYCDEDTHSTVNINDFAIEMVNYCKRIQFIIDEFGISELIRSVKADNHTMILISLAKFVNEPDNYIIARVILYHHMMSGSSCDIFNDIKKTDVLKYHTSVDHYTKLMKTIKNDLEPTIIYVKDSKNFSYVIKRHLSTITRTTGRRKLNLFENVIMKCYFDYRVPPMFKHAQFHNEHIIPFSVKCKDEIDINRIGNMFPLVDKINVKRGNKHISFYDKFNNSSTEYDKYLIQFSKVIPNHKLYDGVVTHIGNGCQIIDSVKYDEMCSDIEDEYIECLLIKISPSTRPK
tara:strand:+ start:1027 stop:2787 length:1761 start_codon:yes stop_codon:yes gene_type:complete